MTSIPVGVTGKGGQGNNILTCQVGGGISLQSTMVVTHAREAFASYINNPFHHGDQHSQEVELPVPPPPSLVDQQDQIAMLVQQV